MKKLSALQKVGLLALPALAAAGTLFAQPAELDPDKCYKLVFCPT